MEEEETMFKQYACKREEDISCEMNLFGEKEGDTCSKINLDRESDEEIDLHCQRAESPVLSFVSMKSDRSMTEPLKFNNTSEPFHLNVSEKDRPPSPQPSYVSLKSDRSMAEPLKFSDTAEPFHYSVLEREKDRPPSPQLSYVSLKSDRSMAEPLKFSNKAEPVHPNIFKREKDRPPSPQPSYVSLKSDRSMAEPLKFSNKAEPVHPNISEREIDNAAYPLPSCVSLKSDRSMAEPLKFSDKKEPFHPSISEREIDSAAYPLPSCVSLKSDRSMAEPLKFSDTAEPFHPSAAHFQFQRASSPQPSCVSLKSDRSMAEPLKFSDTAEPFHYSMKQLTEEPHQNSYKPVDDVLERVKENHKTRMKNRYESLFEGINVQENETLLNRIYTQLYIIEGEREGVNEEHEVMQLEKAKTEHLQGTPINCNDIFQPVSELSYERKHEDRKMKTVLTKGIAGIGKTVSVQKFILDWAEGKANQNVDFVFVLPFRELNLVKDRQYNLHRLLLDFHPELCELDLKIYGQCAVLFIFDGLDESRITLNFSDSEKLSDVSTTSSMCTLMSNLIRGELLPSARIWITSRPAAANQIPPLYVSRVTEVQGFNDPQKEEYFRKRITDEHQASRIILHIRKTRSLYIMCHIPVFCWISATVFQNILQEDQSNPREIPKTLTEMYIHFLIIQINMRRQKYDASDSRIGNDPQLLLESNRNVILKLAELAFKALMNGDVLFYEEDLRESGIDVKEASVYSGICTEIFREESVFRSRTVYCFVHLSFQEFFAALYAFSSYLRKNTDVLKIFRKTKGRGKISFQSGDVSLDVFLKGVVGKALKSKNGHLDLFLRFLHGIAMESNQRRLEGVLTQVENNPESFKNVIKNLRQSQKQNVRPERWINLSHCLLEMKDGSVLEEIQAVLKSETSRKYLGSAHCSALADMLLMSEDVLDELNLKKYRTTSLEAQRRLIPAVRNCRRAILAGCDITEQSCETVASALQSENSPVRELDMSDNELQDSGVKLLCVGLKSQHCKLEIMSLKCCQLTMQSCESVASALLSAHTCLRELDMSNNDLQDSGVKLLSAGLKNQHCKLEILRLAACKLCDQSCETLATVLQSLNGIRELDVHNNDLQDSGVKLLSDGLKSPHCTLEKLRLANCNLTDKSCETVASILQTANCQLRELDMNNNKLQDSGFELLSAGLKSQHCKLQILRMAICNLTGRSCETVAAVLQSSDSLLRELNLSQNDLQDSGVKLLCDGLQSSDCKLELLRLSGCFITEKGCSFLASALMLNPSHLRELDLTCNHPGEFGGRLLSERLEDPTCKLKTLGIEHEGKFRIAAGLRRHTCKLTLDPSTAHKHLALSENNTQVIHTEEEQSCPDLPERFECFPQVLCRESLSSCCSWEIEWSGRNGVYVSVSYKGIERKGDSNRCEFGSNEQSWRLVCSENRFDAWHNNERTKIKIPSSSSRSKRIGVYLDWPAGTVSFYCMSDTHRLTHLRTFHSTFTEPVYAGFGLYSGSSVALQSVLD